MAVRRYVPMNYHNSRLGWYLPRMNASSTGLSSSDLSFGRTEYNNYAMNPQLQTNRIFGYDMPTFQSHQQIPLGHPPQQQQLTGIYGLQLNQPSNVQANYNQRVMSWPVNVQQQSSANQIYNSSTAANQINQNEAQTQRVGDLLTQPEEQVERTTVNLVSASMNTTNTGRSTTSSTFPRIQFRILGFLLTIFASASISFGVANIVVTALTVLKSSTDTGCFSSSFALGPSNLGMYILNWIWVSVGLWASITVYIGGNFVGLIKELKSVPAKAFYGLGIISMIMLSIEIVFSILDSVESQQCNATIPAKFIMPILVVIFSIVELILLIYLFTKLRDIKKNSITSTNPQITLDDSSGFLNTSRTAKRPTPRPQEIVPTNLGFQQTPIQPTVINVTIPPQPIQPREIEYVREPVPYPIANRPIMRRNPDAPFYQQRPISGFPPGIPQYQRQFNRGPFANTPFRSMIYPQNGMSPPNAYSFYN